MQQPCSESTSSSPITAFAHKEMVYPGLRSSILLSATGAARESFRSYGLPVLRLQLHGTTEMSARRGLQRYESFVARDNLSIFPGDWALTDIHWKLRQAEVILVTLDPTQIPLGQALSEKLLRRLTQHAAVSDPQLVALLKALHAALAGDESAEPLFVDGLALALAARLAAGYCRGRSAEPTLMPGRTLPRAIEYIDENLGDRIRLADLANACGMSVFHFARSFKAAYGATPFAYLARARVEAAERLLERDGHSLAEISALTGFASQSHFTSAFRLATGSTPARKRRQQRAG